MSTEMKVKIGGQEQLTSLAELAGLDMTTIEESRGFEALPGGLYLLQIKSAELATHEGLDKKTKHIKIQPVIKVEMEVLNAELVTGEASEVINKRYTNTYWLGNLANGVGEFKALLTDSNFDCDSPDLGLWITECVGHQLQAMLVKKASRDDKDQFFTNIDPKKVGPAN